MWLMQGMHATVLLELSKEASSPTSARNACRVYVSQLSSALAAFVFVDSP